jgi:hypothetical protein
MEHSLYGAYSVEELMQKAVASDDKMDDFTVSIKQFANTSGITVSSH